MSSTAIPSWMTLAADRVTVKLTMPSEANGVRVDTLSLRTPTVRDLRIARQTAPNDEEQQDLNLFASLAEVGTKDLDGLTLKDFNRIQAGYFRLVREDELQPQGAEATG
ncbi:phage tail assembly protein [Pseudomonas brassicacearum]|uniref:phage tail assembly protein n=1 Tax=Pseudomonas brassicacearum TaxID=930166 RepID=UPI00087A5182|nr:phage tail assembly protein [Pseudomonas brassicacearum]KAB0528817.1 phage tail assembly protein [Pseudomonas brassicacearum subsp. brassicacearum]NJP58957.1 phage tail assembly protein [Pseudomonas brassicacearum]BFE89955.1 phage tail assembly protein [Pseudomonas brassicacearum subsp. brassicacearum]SDP10213.1 Phage tail assembly chaperone protein, E, or 41 or 14 [Pseudomonas brassicacearum]